MGRKPAHFNELKKRALSAFEDGRWLTPPEWAELVDFHPIRASYTYLLRLCRWGLLTRARTKKVLYSISRRGQERLAFLHQCGPRRPKGQFRGEVRKALRPMATRKWW